MKTHKSKEVEKTILNTNGEYIEVYQQNNLKGRPIIAGPESPTHRFSDLLEILFSNLLFLLLQLTSKMIGTFSNSYREKFITIVIFYSCDIESLYTSLTTKSSLEAINYWLSLKKT